MVMRRKLDTLPAIKRDQILDDLHTAIAACRAAQAEVSIHHDIYAAAAHIAIAIEDFCEVLTGDRRILHKKLSLVDKMKARGYFKG